MSELIQMQRLVKLAVSLVWPAPPPPSRLFPPRALYVQLYADAKFVFHKIEGMYIHVDSANSDKSFVC